MQMIILPGKGPTDKFLKCYEATYKTYKQVWAPAFSELNQSSTVHSNDFTRQDYIITLMDQDVCAACSFFREVDIRSHIHREDSWFSAWDNEVFDGLIDRDLSKGLIFSYGTVHPDYRKRAQRKLDVFNTLGCLSMLYAQFLNYQLVFGASRNSHKVDGACRVWGSETLKYDVPYFNTRADLIIFNNDSINSAIKKYNNDVFTLFNQRTDAFAKRRELGTVA